MDLCALVCALSSAESWATAKAVRMSESHDLVDGRGLHSAGVSAVPCMCQALCAGDSIVKKTNSLLSCFFPSSGKRWITRLISIVFNGDICYEGHWCKVDKASGEG